MNRDDVPFELLRWDAQESFYRAWHQADDAHRAVLLADPAVPQGYKDNVDNPTGIDPLKTEERFFAAGRNVQLVKHPRYLPFFAHSHDFFEMICVLSGTCRQVFGGRTDTLTAGDLCLVAPEVTHGIEVMDDSLVMNVLIRTSTFLDIFQGVVRDKGMLGSFFLGGMYGRHAARALVFHTQGSDLLRDAVFDMYAEQQLDDEASDRIVCALLTVFLARLTRAYGDSVEELGADAQVSRAGSEMLAYVLEHASTVTLTSLAQAFHYSAPYCSKVVKEASGLTFSELVAQARLQRAMALLVGTQLSVAEVGTQVGYRNPETFIRAFERGTGMTPSQYRRAV